MAAAPLVLFLCAFSGASLTIARTRRGQAPAPQSILSPVVGAGAQYEMDKNDGTKTNFEMAVVGKEPVNGKDAYWFETTMDGQTGDISMKVLLVVDGNSSHAEKMIMQLPGRQPIEMPVAGIGDMGGGQIPGPPMLPEAQDIRDKADDLGNESVTVPAGTFSCEHYKAKDGSTDVWLTKDAPPYGLVKMQGKDQTTLLTKVLTNVHDKITGTPEQFDPMTTGRGLQEPPQ